MKRVVAFSQRQRNMRPYLNSSRKSAIDTFMFNRVQLILLLIVGIGTSVYGQSNPVTTVEVGVLPGLQFSVVRFVAKPGDQVKLVLNNTDDMSHNLLITTPGSREKVVEMTNALGEAGPASGYIPETPDVLWAIPVVAPGETKSVVFKAPEKEGVYPYVCTYPGHGTIMFGAMYVNKQGAMPELAKDLNVPESRRGGDADTRAVHQGHAHQEPAPLHPYKPVPPYHYRVFIDGASPAAIAVALPNQVSYCWDAGTSMLRFAWAGGFLDNSDLWKGKGDAEAKITGEVFFRSKAGFPFRIGRTDPARILYKGYRLKDRYPEFHYQVDGTDVYELVRQTADGTGLERFFRIPYAAAPVFFRTSADEGVAYSSSTGLWKQGVLELSAEQARAFTITMTKIGKL